MNLIKFSLLISFTLFSRALLANEISARVIFLKGQGVFQSAQGKLLKLAVGQTIKENGLLATNKASVLKIEIKGQGVITLGPESRMMLAQEDVKKPPVLELLAGKLRGTISESTKPKPGEDHKLYIKTRTSAMGVRGTDFLIVHNPKNHVTSTVTFKGEVHFYKKQDEEIYESLREDLDQKKKKKIHQAREAVNLKDELSGYKKVTLKPGEFSGAYPSYEKAGAPVKINPQQLTLLAQNTDIETGKKAKVIKGKYSMSNSQESNSYLVPEPPGDKDPDEGNYDSKSADGIRPGGHLDLNTGIYIAPPADAPFDERTNTYSMPEELGGINSATGEYVPPEGLALDPLNGFVGLGPDHKGDVNISKKLDELKKLTGPFNKKFSKAMSIFKEVSRLDVIGVVNYRFTTNNYENYYGEPRAITNTETNIIDGKIHGGFQLYHSEKWLIYPKAHWKTIYHEKDVAAVKRNDTLEMMFGWENHFKHYLFNKKARFIMDINFTTQYMDYRQRQQYDFFTEDSGVRFSERFQFNKNHISDLYYQIRAFQSYHDPNHGNIHNVGFKHRYTIAQKLDFQVGFEHSVRKEQWTANRYKINRLEGQLILPDVFRKTDISGGYTWEWHKSKYEYDTSARRSDDPFALNENIINGFMYRANILLNRRLGNFWKLNALYEYNRMRTSSGSRNKAFIAQTWGGGLTMVF